VRFRLTRDERVAKKQAMDHDDASGATFALLAATVEREQDAMTRKTRVAMPVPAAGGGRT
jgi:hypothetical protein